MLSEELLKAYRMIIERDEMIFKLTQELTETKEVYSPQSRKKHSRKNDKVVNLFDKVRVGLIGTFSFDGTTSTFDEKDGMIMGLPNTGTTDYKNILKCIDIKDRTRFEETTLGIKDKSPIVTFDPILLANGNVIKDTHYRKFDAEGKLIRIDGFTRVLKVA